MRPSGSAHDRFEIRPDARRFENWETYYAGKIGLGVAIDYALQWGLEAIWARIKHLADDLRRQLSTIAGVTSGTKGSNAAASSPSRSTGITPTRSNVGSPRRASMSLSQGCPQRVSTWKPAVCLTSCVRRCIITTLRRKSSSFATCSRRDERRSGSCHSEAEWRGASSVGTPVWRGMQRKWEGMGCPVRAA